MRTIITIGLLMIMLFSPALAIGEGNVAHRITYLIEGEAPLYSVKVNDIWDLTLNDGKITGVSEDGIVWFSTGYLDEVSNFKDALSFVKKKMSKKLDNVNVTEETNIVVNGMEAVRLEGSAFEEGQPVIFLVVVFQAQKGKFGAIAFVGDPVARDLHSATVSEMANSLFPA
jgi:hypothetical protein